MHKAIWEFSAALPFLKDCYAGTVSTLEAAAGRTKAHALEDAATVSYKLVVIRFKGDSINKT